MFSPKDHQVKICMMKSNLEECEKALIQMHSMLPELDVENEQKLHKMQKALNTLKSLDTVVDKLILENITLTAKRTNLKLQCDEVRKALETSQSKDELLTKSLKEETMIIRSKIEQYEDSTSEIAERFRSTHWYYDKEKVNAETNKVNDLIDKLELDKKRKIVDELKKTADSIHPDIPDNIIEIVGKELTEKSAELDEKRKRLEALLQTLAQHPQGSSSP